VTYAIAAAGTGGHVYPALAVGQALLRRGVAPGEVLFIGGHRIEKKVIPAAGFPLLSLDLRGLERRLTARNLTLPWTILRAVGAIRREMNRRRIGVMLGVGGYATVPAAWAARRQRVPVMIHEQNAIAGLANRLTGRFAARVFGSFPSTTNLPKAEWVGNPLRAELADFDRSSLRREALARYGLAEGQPVVGLLGGSLGAGVLNQAAGRLVRKWSGPPISLIQLAGRDSVAVSEDRSLVCLRVVPFEERMDLFYAATDLVIGRSGGSVAELTATGTPSILVPGRFGSGGHQAANADMLTGRGAALTIPEEEVDRLTEVVSGLVFDRTRLQAMSAACLTLAKRDAADVMAAAMTESHV